MYPGQCLLEAGKAAPSCVCNHGFAGVDCSQCELKYTGSRCEKCQRNYIGYNDSCSVLCLEAGGYASEYGGSNCTCYDDTVNGRWFGPACDKCQRGFTGTKCLDCNTGTINIVSFCATVCVVLFIFGVHIKITRVKSVLLVKGSFKLINKRGGGGVGCY